MKRMAWLVTGVLVGSVGWACSAHSTGAGEIGYVEQFALARDREASLKQLIPGTEDFYYYHCLHFQNLEQFDRVEQFLQEWIKRFQYTPRVREIQHRQALLTYRLDPQKSLDYLQRTLNLQFNHQRETVGASPDLPTRLDPTLFARQRLMQESIRDYENLDGFEDAALDWLVSEDLPVDRRRNLLERLRLPDYRNLVSMIIDDLNQPASGGFGSLPIHGMLLLAQLDECLRLKPDLLNQAEFISVYLSKLRPNDDVDLARDAEAQLAYLDRLWSFAQRLAPAHNSLKTHVLYHRLKLDRQRGNYDKPRFMAYIQLPRATSYVNRAYIEQAAMRPFTADLNSDCGNSTQMPPVGDDEPLVRSYLQHLFLTETSYQPYEPYLDDEYLKRVFAETKIVNGLGDPEQWSALIPAEMFQSLKQRVDLDFAFTAREHFSAEEAIRMDLHVKNVSTLIVKVYEINTYNYYRENGREVNTDVNLDGLVANFEETYRYEEPALRRVTRHFEFPALVKPGIYVIDFIGNGQSSRAVIRKGELQYLVRTSTAGHVFTILDEKHNKLSNAALSLAGREYAAGEDGTITVPFSTRPGRQPIVLTHGNVSSLDTFQHDAEEYQLQAGIYVDREALLSRKTASVLVRPMLYLNGTPVTLSVLEEVRLVITSSDLDGVATTKEVQDFKLFEDRESIYEFQVPERLAQIGFALTAKVQNLSQNKKRDLSVGESFQLNGIDRTDKVADLHLMTVAGAYVLELLGKTGEPRADLPVRVAIKHRDFTKLVNVTLRTDAQGQIQLGELADVTLVTATTPEDLSRNWWLRHDQHSHYSTLHGREGESLTLPYMGQAQEARRDELSLLELRGNTFVADRFESLKLAGGMIVVSDLPRGDYELLWKATEERIRLEVAAGKLEEGYFLGDFRQLELRGQKPLQIKRVEVTHDALDVQLVNADTFCRVHLFATRYEPAYDVYGYLGSVHDREPVTVLRPGQNSLYASGRKLGDEYRYIIDRKYAMKYPGNMLERPSLLLNPWSVRKTETERQEAAAGEEFAAEPPAAPSSRSMGAGGAAKAAEVEDDSPDLDFLATGSTVLVNLVPNGDGMISVNRELLKSYQRVWVVAVDPVNTVCRAVSLPQGDKHFIDLRLHQGLDPDKHFTQQKLVSVIQPDQTFTLADIGTARFEAYDSLAKVYSLMVTLSQNPTLVEFGFILNWDQMKPEEKREKYSTYACHELNFFLYHKDRDFFRRVVLPYLQNKKDQTFLDHWLLNDDLAAYLQPWDYSQLNTVERIVLSQRITDEPVRTRRLIKDQFDLLPSNVDRFNFLFDTAVKRSALSADDVVAAEFAKGQAAARPSAVFGITNGAVPAADAVRARRNALTVERSPAPEQEMLEEKAESARLVERREDSTLSRAGVETRKAADKADVYYAAEGERRGLSRSLYQQMDKTQEWAENNYYQLPIEQHSAGLVNVNAFWRDYANSDPDQEFVSTHFAEATNSFAEMMLALALLDLPLHSLQHEIQIEQPRMKLAARSSMVVFHEEIRPAEQEASETPILVSQNFFRHGDRYRYVDNQKLDKYVTDEFLVQTVYGCQIVVTNPTSSPQKLDLLLQVPVGAIPVLNAKLTRSVHADLEPFHTATFEHHFYFPFAGDFVHYPVHVAKNELLLAFASPVRLHVVEQLSNIDKRSWAYISQYGTADDVLAFLKTENLQRIALEKMAFRLQDKGFFREATELLAANHVYDHTLWSYAIKHDAPQAIATYLEHDDGFVAQCGPALESPLLRIDPVPRHTYQHLDYRPLVNARAHQLGQRRQIVNERVWQQYHQLLTVLSCRRELDDAQLMAVTYYMLLQDRIEKALEFFQRVNPDRLATRLQYDYFTAYLDFYTDDPRLAGPIAQKYANYEVDRWRNAFAALAQQLKEIRGEQTTVVDAEDRQQSQTGLAATEPAFDFVVEAKRVRINYQNLAQVKINYYLMDIELLFSRNPFVQQYSGRFSTIRPNLSATANLPQDKVTFEFDLPETLRTSNVLVEITAAGQTRSQAYYANSLDVQVMENYGQLKVTRQGTRRALSMVYVKVYARMDDGEIRFYKDGYTDLRGRFDYTSLNTNDLDSVARFALLIFSENDGAVVREADPPKR